MGNFPVILLSVLLNALAQICIKKGMMLIGKIEFTISGILTLIPHAVINFFVWAGMGCYAVSILLWLIVLSKTEVSYAYPFLSIGYIVTALIGCFFLGEAMPLTKIVGIGVICLGIVIMFRG